MRRVHRREDYIPKGARAFRDRKSSAIVYAYTNALGYPSLVAFHGRAQKPDFRYAFRSEAHREAVAKQHFERWQKNDAYSQEKRAKARLLQVGDVLRSSWGYDQTNIDYYQVTRLVGARSVEIREIAQEASYDGPTMTGKCVPLVGEFIGKPMIKRADGDGVKIASYAWASRIDPIVRSGVPTYDASNYSEYA